MDFSTKKVIANRLATLERQGGGKLTPEAVVKDAADEASPLHSFFEWDDSKAASKYRLQQARTLIKTVKLETAVHHTEVSTVRYVRDPAADGKEQGYVDVVKLRDEFDLARETVKAELGRVVAALERARAIAKTLGLEDDFEALLSRVRMFREKAEVAA